MAEIANVAKALPLGHKILIAGAACALLALLYPPFYIRNASGVVFNKGYSWIFDPPSMGSVSASVDVPLVLLEWVVIGVITGVAWFVTRQRT